MSRTQRVKLTKALVEHLPVPESGYTVTYDSECPQLGVRVNAGGRRTYFALVAHNAKTVRETIGPTTVISSPEFARKKLKTILRRVILEGETPREAAAQRRAEPTLSDAFQAYRQKRFVDHKRSTTNIDSMFELYLEPFADMRMSEITHGQIESLHADIPTRRRRRAKMTFDRHTGQWTKTLVETDALVSGSHANKVIGLVHSIYEFAAAYRPDGKRPLHLGSNPAAGIEKHEEQPRDQRLRKDQAKRFFAALASEPDRDFREWVLVALWTGARSGNTRSMRWEDLDLEAGEWTFTVRKGRPKKSGELRSRRVRVALASPLVVLLKARRETAAEDATYVFQAATTKGFMGDPKRRWEELLKRAKVSGLRIHDLRHSTASWAADAGATGPVLQAMLAHSDPKMSARYTHLHTETMRQAADAMATMMLDAAGLTAEDLAHRVH